MISFALYSIKGGVGKSTSAVNLAHLASLDGYCTLLWDLDPQCAATFYLNQKDSINGSMKELLHEEETLSSFIKKSPYEDLDYIPGHSKNRHTETLLHDIKGSKKIFKRTVKSIKNQYDYVFLDCPPTLNLLSEALFKSADYILLPIVPSALSERTYQQLIEFFKQKDLDMRKVIPFFSMVDLRRSVHKLTMEHFRATQPKILKNKIPNLSLIEKMGEEKAPISAFAYNSRASYAFRSLWQELKTLPKLKSRKLVVRPGNEFSKSIFRNG